MRSRNFTKMRSLLIDYNCVHEIGRFVCNDVIPLTNGNILKRAPCNRIKHTFPIRIKYKMVSRARERGLNTGQWSNKSFFVFIGESMSVNQDEIFVQTKENAHREFSFVDEDTVPLNASKPVPLQPLKPTSAIVVTGYVPPDALRFSVNLLCKAGGNIALHFNARLDRGYVVRNTKFKGCWEEEETCSPAAHTAFRRNSYVHILIFCTANEYQIAVNGEHFCAFSYRMPLEDVTNLEINGSLEDTRFRQFELFVYPDPNLCRPSNVLSLKVDRPIVDFLGVPITVDIENEFKTGTRLFIAGRLKLLPHSFYVNLQKGKAIYPHPVIALHLNPRFLYGNNAPYVVMNCWTNGSWGHEERHSGHLSWMPGRDFLLTIRCELEAYTIWLGDKMIGEFKHRLQPSVIDTLKISGDIVLHELAITYSG